MTSALQQYRAIRQRLEEEKKKNELQKEEIKTVDEIKQLSINDFKVGDSVVLDMYHYKNIEKIYRDDTRMLSFYREYPTARGKITRINKKFITFRHGTADGNTRIHFIHTKQLKYLTKIAEQ